MGGRTTRSVSSRWSSLNRWIGGLASEPCSRLGVVAVLAPSRRETKVYAAYCVDEKQAYNARMAAQQTLGTTSIHSYYQLPVDDVQCWVCQQSCSIHACISNCVVAKTTSWIG